MARVPVHPAKGAYGGLWLAGGKDSPPQGSYRRLTGTHRIHTGPVRSRVGSPLLQALNAHSLFKFGLHRFAGVGISLYRDGVDVFDGFNGNRLSFVRMPPQPGKTDMLFVAGGGAGVKLDVNGTTSNWGIAPPPDGFTAAVQAVKFVAIDNFDTAASWSAVSATLADEPTIKQEGVNSMKMTVVASTTGQASKDIITNLQQFGDLSTSADEDQIQVWLRVDNPTNLNFLQLDFDVGTGNFASDYYTKKITASTVIPPSTQLVSQTVGLATLLTSAQLSDLSLIPNQAADVQTQLDALGQVQVVTAVNDWVLLRLPKKTFNRLGNNGNTWHDVKAVRLTLQTNATGPVIAYWDLMQLVGGAGLQGNYRYQVTFKNSMTGSRSNPNPTVVTVNAVSRQPVALSNLPVSADAQVDQKEIWRSLGNGALLFLADTIPNAQTAYVDQVADYSGLNSLVGTKVLTNTQLPLDNALIPLATVTDAVGPYQGCLWWLDSANPGNAYFSPVGRPESNSGFAQVTNTDDPIQKLVIWNGLWAITQKSVYQIQGTFPAYTAAIVLGTQGTTKPFTVKGTPYGILYWSDEGVRLFNGASSQLIAFPPLAPLFNGETLETIPAFTGLVAEYAREEYVISDGVNTTLALNVSMGTWRNVGLVSNAMFYEWDVLIFQFSSGGNILSFEDEAALATTDNGGASIAFAVEWPSQLTDIAQQGTLERIYLDMDTNSQLLTPTLIEDGVETALPTVQTSGRNLVEIAQMSNARLFGIRLSGSLTKAVTIYRVEADVQVARVIGERGEVQQPVPITVAG